MNSVSPPSRRAAPLLLAGAIALTLSSSPARAQSNPAEEVRERLTGTFASVSEAANQARIDAAIERVVARLVFFARDLARSRLREANPVFRAITVRFGTGSVDVTAGRTVHSRDDGSETTATGLNGQSSHVTQRLDGGRLVQVMWTDQGARRTEFIVSADGAVLTVRVTLTSPQLPAPLTYELTYRR
jgi:hypothetical protein